MGHTEGKLHHEGNGIRDEADELIARAEWIGLKEETHANAQRLAACWNAFDGVETATVQKLDVQAILTALRYYADDNNYDYESEETVCYYRDSHSNVQRENGDKARAALSGVPTEQRAGGAVERLVKAVKAAMQDDAKQYDELRFELWQELCDALQPFEEKGEA